MKRPSQGIGRLVVLEKDERVVDKQVVRLREGRPTTARKPAALPAVVGAYLRLVWILAGLLAIGVLALGAWGIVGQVVDRRPDMQYVTTQEVYIGGRVVEWQVELAIAGESVKAVLYTEREAVRLRDVAKR